ncbi:MAG: anti-sigma factor [Acidimicrobiia bacterium]
MTEPVDLDALASAYIDDELDAADRAAAESDPEVMAKVAQFREIADLMRSPVAIDATARDRSIAAALSHLDQGTSKTIELRATRPRRSWRSNPAVTWGPIGLVAAGLLVMAVMSLGSNDDSGESSSATFAAEAAATAKAGAAEDQAATSEIASATIAAATATTAGGAATTAAAAGSASGASQLTTAAAATGVTDLGPVADAAEIGARITGRSSSIDGASTTAAPATTAAATAAAPPSTLAVPTASDLPSCPGLGAPVAIATLDGLEVVVFDDLSGGFVVVDRACQQVSRLDAAGAVTP